MQNRNLRLVLCVICAVLVVGICVSGFIITRNRDNPSETTGVSESDQTASGTLAPGETSVDTGTSAQTTPGDSTATTSEEDPIFSTKDEYWMTDGTTWVTAATTKKELTSEEMSISQSVSEREAANTDNTPPGYFSGEMKFLLDMLGLPEDHNLYLNKEVSFQFDNGGILTLGTEIEHFDGNILNPVYTPSAEEDYLPGSSLVAYGYYINSVKQGQIVRSISANDASAYDDPSIAGAKSYEITAQTYDTCLPINYKNSEEFGIKWRNEGNNPLNGEFEGLLNIRIVRFPDGELLHIAKVHITYNTETQQFEISKIEDADARKLGLLTEYEASNMIQEAFDFAKSGENGHMLGLDETYWDYYRHLAVIDVTNDIYFFSAYATDGSIIHCAGTRGDVFAVTIPYRGMPNITVYFGYDYSGATTYKVLAMDEVSIQQRPTGSRGKTFDTEWEWPSAYSLEELPKKKQ